jgi:hypothetical protein
MNKTEFTTREDLPSEIRTKIELVETIFNRLFETYHITYGDFNKRFPVKDYKCDEQGLLALEQKHQELGLAGMNTDKFGVSVISLMATITDIFTEGWRFSIILSDSSGPHDKDFDKRRIKGVMLSYYPKRKN